MDFHEKYSTKSEAEWYRARFRPVGKGYKCKRCQSAVQAFRKFYPTHTGIRTTGEVIILEPCAGDVGWEDAYRMHHPFCKRKSKGD